jgi:hypothetical protein
MTSNDSGKMGNGWALRSCARADRYWGQICSVYLYTHISRRPFGKLVPLSRLDSELYILFFDLCIPPCVVRQQLGFNKHVCGVPYDQRCRLYHTMRKIQHLVDDPLVCVGYPFGSEDQGDQSAITWH